MTASIHSAPLVFSAEFTPLGWIGAVATGQGLCWDAFGADPLSLRAHARRTFQPTALIEDAQAIESLMTPIRSYLHMQSRTLEVPFDTRASAFCETVWGALRRIPYGQTRSYTEIAAAIGAPRAVRAVANACAKKPLALITPCPRVIQKNGRLGGYRWGGARKAALLALENRGNTHARAQNLLRSYCAPVIQGRAVLGILTYIKYAPLPALRPSLSDGRSGQIVSRFFRRSHVWPLLLPHQTLLPLRPA